MAKSKSVEHPLVPAHLPKYDPALVLELRDPLHQIAHFLGEIGFDKAAAALKEEAQANHVEIDVKRWQDIITDPSEATPMRLMSMWGYVSMDKGLQTFRDAEAFSRLTAAAEDAEEGGAPRDLEAEEGAAISSDEDSDSTGDSSPQVGQKRKRIMTPSASEDSSDSETSSDSDMDDTKVIGGPLDASSSDSDSDSSSEDDDRPLKRPRLSTGDVPSDLSSDTSSDSSSDSERSLKSKGSSGSASSSESSSNSTSDSDSDSGSSSDSDSDSSSDSSSEDDSSDSDSSSARSSPSPKKANKAKSASKGVPKPSSTSDGSTSSATLVGDDASKPKKAKKETDTLLVPDNDAEIGTKILPATKENVRQLKKDQVPFSRIPNNQPIDPKFSSNKYVSYDYADRAYQDLSVTKGKGFTKEKNKKKRGAYRGGAIDLTPKGIKFED